MPPKENNSGMMAMPSNNKNDAIGPLFVLFAERKKTTSLSWRRQQWLNVWDAIDLRKCSTCTQGISVEVCLVEEARRDAAPQGDHDAHELTHRSNTALEIRVRASYL